MENREQDGWVESQENEQDEMREQERQAYVQQEWDLTDRLAQVREEIRRRS